LQGFPAHELPTLLVMLVMLVAGHPARLVDHADDVITSFGQRDADGNVIYTFTLENYLRLMGFTGQAGIRSICASCCGRWWLAVQTTVIVILMAYPLAYFIARAPEKRRNFLLFLVLIPLWTNFIIRIYAWVMILRNAGRAQFGAGRHCGAAQHSLPAARSSTRRKARC
jgi:spermidine/putrescine transport system permease protein